MQEKDLIKIIQITDRTKNASIKVKIIEKLSSKLVTLKKTKETIEVAEYVIADDSDLMIYQVWGGNEINDTDKLIGKSIQITNGYVSTFANKQRYSKGKSGSVEFLDENVTTIKIDEKLVQRLNPIENVGEYLKVTDLQRTSKKVNIKVKVIRKDEPRTVKGNLVLGTFLVGDPTGCILLALWNEDVHFVEKDVLEINNGYVSVFNDVMQLNKGRYGKIKKIDEDFDVNTDLNRSMED